MSTRPHGDVIEADSDEYQARGDDKARPRRLRPRTLKLVGLVAVVLGLGLLGRGLVAGGVSNGFLSDLLPWLRGTPVTLYFADEDGNRLVPVSRSLTGEEESPEGLLTALLDGPIDDTGLTALVPEGTTARAVVLDGTVLTVDLSTEYALRESTLADEALMQTLVSWPDVSEVRVTIDGNPLDTALSSGHLLFFYDPSRDILVAQPTTAVTARDVLAEYLTGPEDTDLTGLPQDVEVVDFYSAAGSGVLQLNMSYSPSVREMAMSDSDGMRRILEGLMATLTTGFPNTQFLYLDFEGHAKLGLGQCADLLRRVQPRPQVLNDERLMGVAGSP